MLVAFDDLIHIRNKHIIGWGHTDQMRKLSAANASGQSSDLTGAHCAHCAQLLVHIVHTRGGLLVWHQLSHVGVVRGSCIVDLLKNKDA